MKSEARPVTDLLFAVAGPLVWAAHFFSVYLTEALLCSTQEPALQRSVHFMAGSQTVLALVVMLVIAIQHRSDDSAGRRSAVPAFALPLTLLSALAVIWSSLPSLLLPACRIAGT